MLKYTIEGIQDGETISITKSFQFTLKAMNNYRFITGAEMFSDLAKLYASEDGAEGATVLTNIAAACVIAEDGRQDAFTFDAFLNDEASMGFVFDKDFNVSLFNELMKNPYMSKLFKKEMDAQNSSKKKQ